MTVGLKYLEITQMMSPFQPHGSHWKNPLGVDVTVPARKIRPTGRHGWGRCCKSAAAHRTPPLEARKRQCESGFRLGLREMYGKTMAFFDRIQTQVGFSVSCPSTPRGTEELSQTLDLLNASVMAKDGKRWQNIPGICTMGSHLRYGYVCPCACGRSGCSYCT